MGKKFSKKDYPDSWKNFYAQVRYKAIDIANALLDENNMTNSRAIPIATTQAKKWAKKRSKKIFKD